MPTSSPWTSDQLTVHVDTVLADATEVSMEDARGGEVAIPSGSSITSLTFHTAHEAGGTYYARYDDTATTPVAITLTGLSASRSYPLPAKLFGAKFFKMVGNADGDVSVVLKG